MLLLLHGGVRQLLPVDDQVGIVGGLQGEAPVTDAAAMAFLLVLLHDVLQVLPAFGKRQLETKTKKICEILKMEEAGLFYSAFALAVSIRRGEKKKKGNRLMELALIIETNIVPTAERLHGWKKLTWHFLQLYL